MGAVNTSPDGSEESVMNRMWGVRSAAAFLILFAVGLAGFAQWVPPTSPHRNAEQIAALFAGNTGMILLGITCMTLASGLYLPWVSDGSQPDRGNRRPERVPSPRGVGRQP